MKLSIIILCYKHRGHTRQLLRSLQTLNLPYELEVIVISNGRDPELREIVHELMPDAKYIEKDRNYGYAVGNNEGLRVAKGEMVLILNPDIAVFPGSIEKLVEYVKKNPKVGLVGPRLINPDGSVQLSGALFPNFLIALWRRSVFGKWPFASRQIKRFFIEGWDRKTSRPVGWMLGAVYLFPRQVLEKVGLFDENIFLFVEDIDYCRRVWKAGWEVHYVAESEIVHFLSRLSAVNPGLSAIFSYTTRVHIRSWMYYFRKYRGRPKQPYSM
jgi:GT2 family glycosyltransferase